MVSVFKSFFAESGRILAQVSPVPSAPNIDPNRVGPGLLGFLAIFALALVCVALFFFLRGSLSKVNYSEKKTEQDHAHLHWREEQEAEGQAPGANEPSDGTSDIK